MIKTLRTGISIAVGAVAHGVAASGRRPLASTLRRWACVLAPWRVRAWLRHALSLRLLGRRVQGLACLRRAERLLAEAPSASAGSAEALRRARDWAAFARVSMLYAKRADARAAFLRALQSAPDRGSLWREFAELLRQLDDPEAEAAARRRAFEAEGKPGDAEALADALAAAGREASAAEIRDDARGERAAPPPIDLADPPPLASLASARPALSARAPTVALDLTDMVHFLRHNRMVSGIQRVQAEMALALLRRAETQVRPALYDPGARDWRLVSPKAVTELIEGARGRSDVAGRRLARLVEPVERSDEGRVSELNAPLLFTPGATWGDPSFALSVREAKRRYGMRYAPFVHDCVPLLLPETCPPNVPAMYGRWLAGAAELADGFLTNSDRTAADLADMLSRVSDRDPFIGQVRLDGRTGFGSAPKAPMLDPRVAEALSDRGFALVVGSIEPRKNHLMLFEAWEELARRFGSRAPMLVVIGRSGWREEGALDFLDDSELLGGSVVLLHDLSDEELAWAYARARFAVVPSLYEGWGMPVTESLNAGLPTLVAENSALTEAGGDSVVYFDARDRADLTAKLETFVLDDRALAAARKNAEAAPLREWSALADEALGHLEAIAEVPFAAERLAPMLAPERRYDFGARAFGRDLMVQEASLQGRGWLGREPGAIWTESGGEARLAVRTPAIVGEIVLELVAPDARASVSAARIDGSGARVEARALNLGPGERAELRFATPTPPDAGGFVEIAIDTGGGPGRRGVGVAGARLSPGLGGARSQDALGRADKAALSSTRSLD